MAAILDYVTGPQHHCDLCTVQDRSMYEHKRCARTRVYDFYARVYGLTPEITFTHLFTDPKSCLWRRLCHAKIWLQIIEGKLKEDLHLLLLPECLEQARWQQMQEATKPGNFAGSRVKSHTRIWEQDNHTTNCMIFIGKNLTLYCIL